MKTQELKSHAHCIFRINYHIVFITKYRKRVLSPEILLRIRDHFTRLCKNAGCELIEFNGEADHVHLLVDSHPGIAPNRLVNTLKTISSREIRREFAANLAQHYWKPVLWHRAYCVLSAGGAPLEILKQYIQNQGG